MRALLERIPTLTCLVTSRQRLDLVGEQEFPVSPLSTPPLSGAPERLLEFASVQLFVDRAQQVRPDFQVTVRDAAAVAALCERLEGIPLAIELAAGWAQTLTPGQMLDKLSRRFELLVSRNKDLSPRHRSLRTTLDWSYRLLTPDLQRFFARLSVFRGGWTLEAVEAIYDGSAECSGMSAESIPSTLDSMAQLCAHSLLVAEESERGMRYRLLETLREYAGEQLESDERARLERDHAAHFLELAETAAPGLRGPEQAAWLARLEEEHDNLRAALAWSLKDRNEEKGIRDESRAQPDERGGEDLSRNVRESARPSYWLGDGVRPENFRGKRPSPEAAPLLSPLHPAQQGLRLAAALWRFWYVRGYLREGRDWLAKALALPSAQVTVESGDELQIARATALNGAGVLAWLQGDCAAARLLFEECLALKRATGDRKGVAGALSNLAFLARDQGDLAAARSACEEGLAIYQGLDHAVGIATALGNLGAILIEQGDLAVARPVVEEGMAACRNLGDESGLAMAVDNLGEIVHKQGEYKEARILYGEGLALWWGLGDRSNLPHSLTNLGNLAQDCGDPERAAVLFGAAEILREAIGAPIQPPERAEQNRRLAAVRAALGEAAFAAAWAQGRAMTPEHAVEYALAQERS